MLFESSLKVAVCDTGLGNLRSVERAISAAAAAIGRSARVVLTRDPQSVRDADKVVMPGQGGFGDCARALSAEGLGEAVRESIARGAPYLGICLGLQVLFGASEEAPECAGLGVFEGRVARLAGGVDPLTGAKLKIPHVGWNVATPGPSHGFLPERPTYFYFVHSYAVVPRDPRIVASTTDYGTPFVSAVAKDNVFACQFHPEKSQKDGLLLLQRFLAA